MKKLKKIVAIVMAFSVVGTMAAAFAGCSDDDEKDPEKKPGDDVVQEADESTKVTVSSGQIVGYNEDGLNIYKGIPYVAAPVGDLRWQDPRPAENWTDVKTCTEYGPNFYQPKSAVGDPYTAEFLIDNDLGIEEDGLYMNIWAPEDMSTVKEVLVYIHGGALASGSGSIEIYEGESLAKQGVVYVSFNYRLGNFTKMASTELSEDSDCGASGNYALKDCVAALEWVNENISVFGGDPENVTIMGQSAGAGLVSTLCVSPKAAGLFDQAVISSGNSMTTASLPTLEDAEAIGDEIFDGRTLEEMRALSARDVSMLSPKGLPNYCIDGIYLTEASAEMLRTGKSNDVTILTGYVSGDLSLSGTTSPTSAAEYETLLTERFGEEALDAYPSEGIEDFAEAYNGIYRDAQVAKLNYVNQLMAEGGSEKDVYIWFFTHVLPGPDADRLGCFHTADIPYWTDVYSDERAGYWTNDDYEVGAMMSGYLINFVKMGTPNGKDKNGKDLTQWAPCGQVDKYLYVGEQSEMCELTEVQVTFWNNFYKNGGNGMF